MQSIYELCDAPKQLEFQFFTKYKMADIECLPCMSQSVRETPMQ